MVGHGTRNGLLTKDWESFIINDENASYLQGKDNLYIWCWANYYVERNNLKGYSTGMFISEKEEAAFCEVDEENIEQIIENSNNKFAQLVGENLLKPTNEIFKIVSENYYKSNPNSKVVKYNCDLMKYFD